MKWTWVHGFLQVFLLEYLNLLLFVSPQNTVLSVNKPIRVIPPESSCSESELRLPQYLERYFANSKVVTEVQVRCSTDSPCTITKKPPLIFKHAESIQIGQDGCSIPGSSYQGGTGARVQASLVDPKACFHDITYPYSTRGAETWLLKFKPGSSPARGTLLDAFGFNLDVAQGDLIFRQIPSYAYTRGNLRIPLKDGWNQIAVQVNFTHSHYNIFLEGELKSMISLITVSIPSKRRRKRQDGNSRVIRIGQTSNIGDKFAQCQVVENDFCRNTNASAFYSMPTRFASDKNENDRLFRASLQSAVNSCENFEKMSLEHYLCSLYFPRCLGDGDRIEPCSEFCEEITKTCPQLSGPAFNCSSLKSVTAATCTERYLDGIHLLKGTVTNLEIYDGILVDQEIYRRHRGQLPEVSRPDCLCPESAPHLQGLQCYDDLRMFFPRIPIEVGNTGTQIQPVLVGDFLPEFMNDNRLFNFSGAPFNNLMTWFSAPEPSKFTVEIDFEGNYIIESVIISLLKPMPSKSLTLERRVDNEWRVMHHFANDCEELDFPPFVIPERPDIVGCTPYKMAGVDMSGFNNEYDLNWALANSSIGFSDYIRNNDHRIQQFFQTNGLRVIFDGPPLGNYSEASENYHAVSEILAKGRPVNMTKLPCNCYSQGTVYRSTCDADMQCQCLPEINRTLSGKQCLPYIETLYPTFGPRAGGTYIVIRGTGFGNRVGNVSIGNFDCQVNRTRSNDTYIICKTNPLKDDSLLEEPLVITIYLASQFTIYYRHPFIYKPDPVIEDIYPRESITRGGVFQTIIGQDLDSVFNPQLILYMKDSTRPDNIILGPERCHVRNSTLMECPTPEIPLPTSHQHLNKRSIMQRSNSYSDGDTRYEAIEKREKRNTIRNWINDHQLDWFMGLILDGVKMYLNLSQSLPDKAQLLIFTTPKIFPFMPEIQVLKVHKGQKTISIKGDKLQYGVQEDDYHISIGYESCEVNQLLSNLIVCSPPTDKKPSAQDHDIHDSGALRVTARIGEKYSVHVGFLKYELTSWDDPAVRAGVIAFIIILLLLLLLAYPAYRFIRGKMAQAKSKEKSSLTHMVSYRSQENYYEDKRDLMNRIDPTLRMKVRPCLIGAEKLTCHHEIGKGNFGVVYVGDLQDDGGTVQKVAIKTIKEQDATLTQISEFLGEASVMKEFDHDNVLSLIGIVIQGYDVYVILPFMENGSLKHFVQDRNNTFTVLDLVHLASQACQGMAYLESQKFVHRDLAARNCMVDEEKVVKIADFGLARDIYETDYYRPEDRQRPLPYKWMAIECVVLDAKKFTTKSDVWSFGVLLWEVMTRGRTPYSEIPADRFGRFLRSNGRLEKPTYCPDAVYQIMMSCWRANPSDRPNFSELVETFESLLGPYISSNNIKKPEYTRLSAMARRDIQSSDEYSTANYSPDYLQLIETPTIDDLLLPEQPELEQNGDTQSYSYASGGKDSANTNDSTDKTVKPPPLPHHTFKPPVPKKPTNISNQSPEEVDPVAPSSEYDNNYLHTRKT